MCYSLFGIFCQVFAERVAVWVLQFLLNGSCFADGRVPLQAFPERVLGAFFHGIGRMFRRYSGIAALYPLLCA